MRARGAKRVPAPYTNQGSEGHLNDHAPQFLPPYTASEATRSADPWTARLLLDSGFAVI